MENGSRSPYVLHVEDDEGDAYLVVRALTQSGCKVRIGRAKDGREANDLFARMAAGELEKPALVLLDLKLPMVSGLEVLEYVRSEANLSDIPVVVFTSSDVAKDEELAREKGCSNYFVKPIDYVAFKSTVGQICEKYLGGPAIRVSGSRGAFAI